MTTDIFDTGIEQCKCTNPRDFIIKTKKVSYLVKQEPFDVEVDLYFCKGCDKPKLNQSNLKEIERKAVREHCKKHDLLLPEKIIEMRKNLGMSQVEFSKYLKYSVASVCFWEKGSKPHDRSTDDFIRIKTSPQYVVEHKDEIESIKRGHKMRKHKLQLS